VDVRETDRRVLEQFRSGEQVDGMQRDRLLLLTTTGGRPQDRLLVENHPFFAGHQAKTERVIPVVALARAR
jgi:hypothetical protein